MKAALRDRITIWIRIVLALVVSATFANAAVLDHWTTVHVSTNAGMAFVVYGGGSYVAYGSYSDWGVIRSSEDGMQWTLRSDGGGRDSGGSGSGLSFPIALASAGNKFFALGGFGTSAVSSNGVQWTLLHHPYGGEWARGVAYGSSKYVAAGNSNWTYDDQNVFTSDDGLTWTAQHSASPAGASLGDVAYGAGVFAAIGIDDGFEPDSGHLYTSPDGITWTQQSIPGGSQISFNNKLFIVPFGPGTNLISDDAVNWVSLPTGIADAIDKVTFANGLFMARAGLYLATSTDGTNWSKYSRSLPGVRVATDGNRLVTIGGAWKSPSPYFDGYIYYSDVLVELTMGRAMPPNVSLSGLMGRQYRIDSADMVPADGRPIWQRGTNFRLPSDPFVWIDPSSGNSTQRFYRAALLP